MDAKDFFQAQLTFNNRIVNENIEGITHDESLLFHSGANCVNWLLGHIVYGRNLVLKISGADPVWDDVEMKCYGRGIDAKDYKNSFISFEELKTIFNESFERIHTSIGEIDISGKVKDLAGLALHEIYHSGQIGYCRRLLGKEGKIK